jgi:hypothetical protein
MVTGREPFKGSTSMDTLAAIIRELPVPAIELNPEDRDPEYFKLKIFQRCSLPDNPWAKVVL